MGHPKPQPNLVIGNDVTSLFSRFGEFTTNSDVSTYKEVIRHEAAYEAACRWPLLAEISGLHMDASGEEPDGQVAA